MMDQSNLYKTLFRCEFFFDFNTVALIYIYIMLHACVTRFDLTENLEKFLVFGVNTKKNVLAESI